MTITRPIPESAPAELTIRTILAPTDLSPSSEKSLRYADALARQFGARVTVLYVSPVQLHGDEFCHLPIEETAVESTARQCLEKIAERTMDSAHPARLIVRNGVACEQIVAVASEIGADLIVVSTHGYTGFKRAFIGSTAERTVRIAPCPVLVVRDAEHDFTS